MTDWLKWMMVGDLVRVALIGGFIGLGIASLIRLGFELVAVFQNARALKEPPDLYDLRLCYFHAMSATDTHPTTNHNGKIRVAVCQCAHCEETRTKLGLMRAEHWRSKNVRLS